MHPNTPSWAKKCSRKGCAS